MRGLGAGIAWSRVLERPAPTGCSAAGLSRAGRPAGPVRRSGLRRRADCHALCRLPRRDDGPCELARSGDAGQDAELPRQDQPPSPHTRRIDRPGPRWLRTSRSVARSFGRVGIVSGSCPSGRGFAPRFPLGPRLAGIRRHRGGWRTCASELSVMLGTQETARSLTRAGCLDNPGRKARQRCDYEGGSSSSLRRTRRRRIHR